MLWSLLEEQARSARNLSSLRIGVASASYVPIELVERMRDELGIEHIVSSYGLTEARRSTRSAWSLPFGQRPPPDDWAMLDVAIPADDDPAGSGNLRYPVDVLDIDHRRDAYRS